MIQWVLCIACHIDSENYNRFISSNKGLRVHSLEINYYKQHILSTRVFYKATKFILKCFVFVQIITSQFLWQVSFFSLPFKYARIVDLTLNVQVVIASFLISLKHCGHTYMQHNFYKPLNDDIFQHIIFKFQQQLI